MQFYLLIFLSSLGTAFAMCNHDNCARAVTGIKQGSIHQAVASSDCSNFLQTTVTAPASMTVVTVTPIVNTTITFELAKLQPTATIPDYASDCKGSAAYSSACSCLGVTATIITAPASVSMN
jgi:hypothetical protein